jgi:hypothetical protein
MVSDECRKSVADHCKLHPKSEGCECWDQDTDAYRRPACVTYRALFDPIGGTGEATEACRSAARGPSSTFRARDLTDDQEADLARLSVGMKGHGQPIKARIDHFNENKTRICSKRESCRLERWSDQVP